MHTDGCGGFKSYDGHAEHIFRGMCLLELHFLWRCSCCTLLCEGMNENIPDGGKWAAGYS